MGKTVKRGEEEKATGNKKPYLTPSVVCYGALKELTRGGSGAKAEGIFMTAKNRHS